MRRELLPHVSGRRFITDGGMETTLVFHTGLDLPHFAAFPLLDSDEGDLALRDYYEPYVRIARDCGVDLLLDTPTWRANRDWGARLGYGQEALVDVNRRGVQLLDELRAGAGDEPTILIGGCVGPRGDAYRADDVMTEAEAEQYHAPQIAALAEAGADLVDALTLTNPPEALGIARAAGQAGIPAVISFTVDTDGSLPNGMRLRDAIEEVEAGAGRSVAYFMVNCAHPTHFAGVLEDGGAWLERIRGVRANASAKSHAELDEAEELDEGDPVELAEQYLELGKLLPNLTVVGGCCGTDHRHVGAICSAWSERGASTA
jgi:S-methylmethionine-dependent homocysteine/selenocysteine methylase